MPELMVEMLIFVVKLSNYDLPLGFAGSVLSRAERALKTRFHQPLKSFKGRGRIVRGVFLHKMVNSWLFYSFGEYKGSVRVALSSRVPTPPNHNGAGLDGQTSPNPNLYPHAYFLLSPFVP